MINTFTLIRSSIIVLLISNLFGGSLTIIAVGDIMMGTTYPTTNLPPDKGVGLFQDVAPYLSDADLTLGNLEGTLLSGGVSAKKIKKGRCYAFRTPPDYAKHLSEAGFDFVNLANNHMNDFGFDGIVSTVLALRDVGIDYGGPLGKVGWLKVSDKKIAVVCFSTSPNTNTILEIAEAQQIVAAQEKSNDIVIVSFHGGGEGLRFLHTRDAFEYFLGTPRGNVVRFARAMIDSGADFVWGHGPHVPRAMEIFKDRLIAYSLGNFYTWGFNVDEERGFAPILKVVLDSSGVFKHGQIISALQRSDQPLILDTLHHAANLIQRLSRSDFPNSSPEITDVGFIFPRKKEELEQNK